MARSSQPVKAAVVNRLVPDCLDSMGVPTAYPGRLGELAGRRWVGGLGPVWGPEGGGGGGDGVGDDIEGMEIGSDVSLVVGGVG